MFCASGAPEDCGEQSCVPGDLLRQPPPGARQPLRAARHPDEPAGQDQVSATCSNPSLPPAAPTAHLTSQKKGKTHT